MNNSKQKNQTITYLAILTAIMLIMALTPLGTLPLGFVSITIAHIPILIATLILGLKEGLIMALIFGLLSMSKAIMAPEAVIDPLFANPLISILPRLMIPIMTHLTFKLSKSLNNTIIRGFDKLAHNKDENKQENIFAKLSKSFSKSRKVFETGFAAVIGNLTNTFFVYLSIYLFVRVEFETIMGKSALTAIIALISSTTLIKTIIVTLITTPIAMRIKARKI